MIENIAGALFGFFAMAMQDSESPILLRVAGALILFLLATTTFGVPS